MWAGTGSVREKLQLPKVVSFVAFLGFYWLPHFCPSAGFRVWNLPGWPPTVTTAVPASLSTPGDHHASHRCRQITYSEDLPQISVVFIFVNEALSVILRSVHSVVNHTPSQLLKEVILVDDNSDNGEWL
jgi:cellulose synthase/poly-beta-1,6-N-acetylglucosamine synthase-like glycosyltransferase